MFAKCAPKKASLDASGRMDVVQASDCGSGYPDFLVFALLWDSVQLLRLCAGSGCFRQMPVGVEPKLA